MELLIIWSIFYFGVSLYILFKIREFSNNMCWKNILNILKLIFLQFFNTSLLILISGEAPTFNQSLFMGVGFLCLMFYIIFDCLKSGDIASFLVSLIMIFVIATTILLFCLLVVSYHNISNMIKAFMIFFIFTILFISLAYTRVVRKYRLVYSCYILIISILGFILLFTAYKFPDDASYKSIHNTIYSWGKISSFNSSDDIVQVLQAILLFIGVPYLGHIFKLIIKKSASMLDNISQNIDL